MSSTELAAEPSRQPLVRVIIVNYNGGAWLRRAVDGLLAQTFTAFEAVVVDNASSDGSLDTLPQDARLSVLRLTDNVGFAAANNRGAAGAQGRWIAALNPDAVPEADWLERLLAAAQADPETPFFGSTQLCAADPERYDGTGDGLTFWGFPWRGELGEPVRNPHPAGWVVSPCAAAALYDRLWFERLGGFDEALFCYLEDVDLGLRCWLAGGRCRQVGDAVVHHAGSAITGSEFTLYHSYRNQTRLMLRNWPAVCLPAAMIGHGLMLLLLCLHFARRGHAGPVVRGIRAGFREMPTALRDRPAVQATRRLSAWGFVKLLALNPWVIVRRPCAVLAQTPPPQ